LNILHAYAEILDQMLDGTLVVDNSNVDLWFDAKKIVNLTKLALKKMIMVVVDIDFISKDLPLKLQIKIDDS